MDGYLRDNARSENFKAWIRPDKVLGFEKISRTEVYRRMQPGDPHLLVSTDRRKVDGKPGRLIDPLSMSYDAQKRWREWLLGNGDKPSAATVQGSLLEQTEVDRKIAALSLSSSERDVVVRRFRIVDRCLNHNWKAEGYPSLGAYMTVLAEREKTTKRSIQRWIKAYKEREEPMDLAVERRGPEEGTGTILDRDMRAHLIDCFVFKKLRPIQCYRSLINYLETKQKSVGCRVDHLYRIPRPVTVNRFLRSRSAIDHAARQGPEAQKAACGYLDRSYLDCVSLERVDVDEWKCDLFAYDMKNPKIVMRWWLLTFYDERSMYPLCWKLVKGNEYELRRGICEEDEIELLVCLLREFGVPGWINSDHGRFRGKTFGGKTPRETIDEKFQNLYGILDWLGIRKSEPRKKNPQGNRLERFHRYLADCSRTLPGWIGADTKEREMSPGDAQKELHFRWTKGDESVPKTPLLSSEELTWKIDEWMEAWRDHESRGTDMNGLSPRAVFLHKTPEGGFRKISDDELAWKTAEHFPGKLIATGGIIELRDGARYSHPLLTALAGQRREVVRLRHDHSQVSVLPAAKGQAVIIAPRRVRVGVNDPENLARQIETQERLRKLVGHMVQPLDLEPSEIELPAPVAAKTKPAVEEGLPPNGENEISGIEYLMEREANWKVKPRDFADLE